MRIATPEEIAGELRALDEPELRVVAAGNFASPQRLLQVLDGALERYRIFGLNAQDGWPRREGVITETPFVGPAVRDAPTTRYEPARLSLVPRLFDTHFPPQVVLLHTSPPWRNRVSLGIEVNILPAALDRVRRRGGLVIAQVNNQMPYTFGDAEIDVEDIDLALVADEDLASPPPRHLDDSAHAIGSNVARYLSDGSTIQLGIGEIPDAALSHFLGCWDLAVWSEMISDGVLNLERRGRLRPQEPIVASFLFGSPELYAWADRNPRLLMRRTEVVNSPAAIAARPAMLSLNAALEVDLFAQANATHVRGRIYSGFGGQPDFVVGALHSPGGHAIIALRSWHDRTDSSCVVPQLESPVCTFQHSVVVSEHGSAEIFGLAQADQMGEIIGRVADPRAREELSRAAARWR